MEASLAACTAMVRTRSGQDGFDLAVVLGSGLGSLVDLVEGAVVIPYGDLPGFPVAPLVAGHGGQLVAGTLDGWRVLCFQGRFHLYQGFSARQAALPVRLAHQLHCRRLLLTNAAGGIRSDFCPGDFMYLTDHLNYMGDNPLRGETRNPFVDLCRLYSQGPFPALQRDAAELGIVLHQGVLAALCGPSYETPAEIRALGLLGADAVGMSTVPEAVMGAYLGFEVVGLSLISNRAAGLVSTPLSHAEVLANAATAADSFHALCRRLLLHWQPTPSAT